MESSTTRSIAFNNLSNLISCQLLKKHQMSHLNPLCFSNQIVFVSVWVFVCVSLRSHLNPLCFSNQIVFVSVWVFVCVSLRSHLNPLCFSNQIVFVSVWVFVCVSLRSHWYFKQDKGNQFLLGLLSSLAGA